MKNLVRCRACGYIMAEGDVEDLCPACGLPKTVFEPYKDKVSEQRRKWIDLHIHPVVVHFPPVSAIGVFFGLLAAQLVGDPWRSYFLGTVEISLLLMPFTVLAALVSGFIDGKLRFKKATTPVLRKKMIAGVVCLILSVTLSVIGLTNRYESLPVMLALSAGCLACNTYLGRIGSKLMDAILPG